jgi:outer membrane receptor for ferrienterochelin and colicins
MNTHIIFKPIILLFLLIPISTYSQSQGEISFWVNGACGMCQDRIEAAAMTIAGVESAEWNVETRMLKVKVEDAESFDEMQLHYAVTGVGHDTKKVLASEEKYEQLHSCCKYRDVNIEDEIESTGTLSIWVDGICGMCKDRIEEAVLTIAGVKKASWDVPSRILQVKVLDPENFDEMQIHNTVAGVGHDTKKVKATEEEYEQIHACCKYRDSEVAAAHEGYAEGDVRGRIVEVDSDGERIPLIGVNVYWEGSASGVVTNEYGHFSLDRISETDQLVISYIGYSPMTLDVADKDQLEVSLSEGVLLEAVEVVRKKGTTEVSYLKAVKVQQINRGELRKAACCNLSESFETNPSVDVSFTDAVTGTRQIQMLGLAGPYVQITRENMPDIRGLSAIYGLTYTPGPWVESIQLGKGPGSVVNGYESMAGQINVELKKPQEGEQLHLNFYGNQGSRLEGNANWRVQLNENWSTGLLVHGSLLRQKNDRNEDGFLDMPLSEDLILINRWKWYGQGGWEGQFGFKGTFMNRSSGQLSYFDEENFSPTNGWGAEVDTRRLEGWMKTGRVFPNRPYASMGFQFSGLYHEQNAFFGERMYDGIQRSAYGNFIYQTIINTTDHEIKTGASLQYDQYEEQLGDTEYDREEIVPGAYMEYTFKPDEKFTLVAGLRGDYHNNFGFFASPRLHMRYALAELSILRASAGSGRRTASVLAENIGALASNRQFVIQSVRTDQPYGLDQEISWNFGLNFTQGLILNDREFTLGVDLYHTRFNQQIIVDYDQNPQELNFYNLDGESWSNSAQVQVDYELLKDLDIRLAYRFNDVQMDFQQERLEKPFVAQHRAFVNLAYELKGGWEIDLTVNWQGSKRLPFTASNPEAFQLEERSPDFFLTNTQITKSWNEVFDLYLGVENLFNFVQQSPILSADDPSSPYFDASLVWGPIFGRMVYVGARYEIK